MITDQGSRGELEGAQAILLAVIAKVDLNPFSRQNTWIFQPDEDNNGLDGIAANAGEVKHKN